MKRTRQIMLLSLSVLLLVVACRKVNNSRSTEPPPYYGNPGGPPPGYPGTTTVSLNELFKEFRSIPEKQCVTAGIPQTVTFAKGTRLTFYPNSFKDEAGNIITSGTVCLEMVEMYKPGDMIANRATTATTDGELLISGGQVSINATRDGKKVHANKYGIAFPQPVPSTQPMELYYGNTANKDSVVQWQVFPDSKTPGTRSIRDSAGSGSGAGIYYLFDSCTNLSVINCDRLHDRTSPRTPVNVVMSDTGYNWSNTQVFLILHEINAAVGGFIYSASTNTFNVGSDHPLHEVPTGVSASLAIMCKKNNAYYYFEKTGLTVTAGMTVTATMKQQTLDYIKTRLKAL